MKRMMAMKQIQLLVDILVRAQERFEDTLSQMTLDEAIREGYK